METDNVIIPNGFIIDLYKFLDTTTEDHGKMEEFYKEKEVEFHKYFEKRELAYGHYDRIQFRPVKRFSEYTEMTSRTYNWLGTSQSILVFPLAENDDERVFANEDTQENSSLRIRMEDNHFAHCTGFVTASFCYISDEARYKFADYRCLLSFCRDTILGLINAYNQKAIQNNETQSIIKAEVFGTFSSAEIVILCSAKQYVDILYMVDLIKDIQAVDKDRNSVLVNVFRSTYTTISYPDNLAEYDENRVRELFQDAISIKGEALIGIGMQENTDTDYFEGVKAYITDSLINVSKIFGENENPPCEILLSAGEFDLVVKTKSKYISRLFHKSYMLDDAEKNLNIHNEIFHKYFLNTSTRLCYKTSDLPDFIKEESWNEGVRKLCKATAILNFMNFDKQWRSALIRHLWDNNRKILENVQKKIRSCFPAVSSFSVVLDQMFSDYVQCCSTAADYIWIQDYNIFIEKVLLLLEFYLDDYFLKGKGLRNAFPDNVETLSADYGLSRKQDSEDGGSIDPVLQEMTRLVESVEQQTNHIAASSKLFFKEQNAHFGYTAQYDLVIHAYYGMIKELMEEIFRHQNSTGVQSKLFPLINFRPVHAIDSEMFIESDKPSKCDSERIIIFRLPLDTMNNILHYTPMLIHEVYHYAAPFHRKGRNEFLTLIGVFCLLREAVCNMFSRFVEERVSECISTVQTTMPTVDIEDGVSDFSHLQVEVDAIAALIFGVFNRIVENAIIFTLETNKDAVFLDISRYQIEKNEDEILRSWHRNTLDKWIFRPIEDEGVRDNRVKKISFEQLLQLFAEKLRDDLLHVANNSDSEFLSDLSEEELSLFLSSVDDLLEQMNKAGNVNKDFLQSFLDSVDKSYSNTVDDVFFQLDELLPDCAMVSFTGMPISGYLLQIAINHDVNFFEPNVLLTTDQLRYGLVMDWIMAKSSKIDVRDTLNAELKQFKEYYCAVYRIRTPQEEYDNVAVLDQAERWSEYFNVCFSVYTGSFRIIRPWLLELIGKHIAPLFNNPSNQFCDVYGGYLEVLNAEEKDRQKLLFRYNLDTIKRFQTQKLITEINTIPDATALMRPSLYKVHDLTLQSVYTYYISSYSEMHYTFDWIINKLHEYRKIEHCWDNTGMWFRGVGNSQFSILPSGFVNFFVDCEHLQGKCCIDDSNYLSCLRRVYESFRYVADGASEHQNPSFYTEIDHLALMQHYQQHTNLVDWSEDIDTSLYFALESEIVANERYCDIQDDSNYNYPDKDAVVYILDPIRFNQACREMENELQCVKPYEEDDLCRFEQIPNLSVLQKAGYYREFYDLYNSMDIDNELNVSNKWLEMDENADRRSLTWIKEKEGNKLQGRLPRAVYTSKINPRLKAQSGMFVAFSLLSRPAIFSGQTNIPQNDRRKLFDYQSINELQELYLRLGADKGGRNPFLYRIIIPKELKRLIGRRLYRLGFSKEKFYPEIQNHHSR